MLGGRWHFKFDLYVNYIFLIEENLFKKIFLSDWTKDYMKSMKISELNIIDFQGKFFKIQHTS